jgi:hypothetical protein
MPTGCKIEESSLHDAEGETGHPIIPCGVHHPLPPDLFDLHARTPKAKTNAMSAPPHMGKERRQKTISSWVLSAQAFRRAAGAPERTRSCRMRPAAAAVAPLPPAHPCRPPRPPALATSRAPARAWPAAPFLEPPPAPRTASSVPLSNQQNWRWSHMKSGADWRLTPGPAPAHSTEPTAQFFSRKLNQKGLRSTNEPISVRSSCTAQFTRGGHRRRLPETQPMHRGHRPPPLRVATVRDLSPPRRRTELRRRRSPSLPTGRRHRPIA